MWQAKETHIIFHYCDQSVVMYLNWYLRYQTIHYDKVSLIFLLRST